MPDRTLAAFPGKTGSVIDPDTLPKLGEKAWDYEMELAGIICPLWPSHLPPPTPRYALKDQVQQKKTAQKKKGTKGQKRKRKSESVEAEKAKKK